MPRVTIKGGIWRNTEDEILKAAVMKYGKNQWARIASLLHRKSAKQCKARWTEWLDPGIKKTEWSKDEEEKLLHLAKLMPCQWRTIAPIIGRTASQCLEHYEQLLDRAAGRDGAEKQDDPRRLRPGEIDTAPETKPARPDMVDMDEDELEMLSEARARLANTQGKKAKRKARERQLQEARRLAALQKRRELRAAGIRAGWHFGLTRRQRARMVDYNREIPFEKPVPRGFHDVSEEKVEKARIDFSRLRQNELEQERVREREMRDRQQDGERIAKRRESDMPGYLLAQALGAGGEPTVKRSKLVLPAPEISESELEQVVKIGAVNQQANETVAGDAQDDGGPGGMRQATTGLLSEYRFTDTAGLLAGAETARTARTPYQGDAILREAAKLAQLTYTETPLKGNQTPLPENVEFGGIQPRRTDMRTPNVVLGTPFRTPAVPEGLPDGSQTPASASVSGSGAHSKQAFVAPTPLRDKLSINRDGLGKDGDFDDDAMSTFESVAGSSSVITRGETDAMRAELRKAFASLPAPKNDFEIVVPDEAEAEAEDNPDTEFAGSSAVIQDRANILEQMKRDAARIEELEARKRSQVVQRRLPRPVAVNFSMVPVRYTQETNADELNLAGELIKSEMIAMMSYDTVQSTTDDADSADAERERSAIRDREPPKRAKHLQECRSLLAKQDFELDEFSFDQIAAARSLVSKEIAAMRDADTICNTLLDGEASDDQDEREKRFATVWSECVSQVVFVPTKQRYGLRSLMNDKQRIEVLEKRLESCRAQMTIDAKRAVALEKRLKTLLGGYQLRADTLSRQLTDVCEQLEHARIEENCFSMLRAHESAATPHRIESARDAVQRQLERERELQGEFDTVMRRYQQVATEYQHVYVRYQAMVTEATATAQQQQQSAAPAQA